MIYRIRNIKTEAAVLQGEEFIAENDDPVWVLECEAVEGEWTPSGFHRKDINGVLDPRPYSEILPILQEA